VSELEVFFLWIARYVKTAVDLVLQNDTSTIGLYQGMSEKNSLTYNPGWDRDCKTLAEFQDVREIQQELKQRGLNPVVARYDIDQRASIFDARRP